MFISNDEFGVLTKRVERMESAVGNVVRKVFKKFFVCLKQTKKSPHLRLPFSKTKCADCMYPEIRSFWFLVCSKQTEHFFIGRKECAFKNTKIKIDSIVNKIDQMDRQKARQDSAREKLFGEIGEPAPRRKS